jgi:phage shock protein A
MNESLTSRVGRLISGSVNALIDAVENTAPEAVMQQAINEVDGVIDEVRVELGKVIAAKHLSNTRLSEENNRYEELSGNIELAVAEGREDLAETAISKQLDIEVQIPVLEQTISDYSQREKELDNYILALQAKKREMESELRELKAVQQQEAVSADANSGAAMSSGKSYQRDVEKAQSAFDRVYEKAAGVPAGRADSLQDAAQLSELEELAHKNRVQERLQAIKSKMKK